MGQFQSDAVEARFLSIFAHDQAFRFLESRWPKMPQLQSRNVMHHACIAAGTSLSNRFHGPETPICEL